MLEEGQQVEQLPVAAVHEPAFDGDPVLQLVPKGLRGVVHDHCLAEVPAQDGQVLDVVAVHKETMLTEQSTIN